MIKISAFIIMSTLLLASCGQRGNKAAAGTPATSEEQAVAAEVVTPAIPKVGDKFVDFTITVSEGKTVKFSDYIGCGKVVLVDFWASWCGPCRREIPNIKAVYDKYKGEKFNVLGVAVWDEPEKSLEAIKELEITWDVIINAQKIPSDLYGIEYIPQIMLFGADGTLLATDLRGPAVEEAVKKALGL